MFQTSHWSAPGPIPPARRLHGCIAPTFGTTAAGRNNPPRFNQGFVCELTKRPYRFTASFVSTLLRPHVGVRGVVLFCPDPGRFDDRPPFFDLGFLLRGKPIRR